MGTAIAGLRGTGDFGEGERPKNFREYILFRNPNGSAPITALMAKTKSSSVDDPEFNWWDEPQDIWRGQVNGALAAGDQLWTFDSNDPSATAPTRNFGTCQHLVPGDILLVEKTETATYDNELVRVRQVISDTQIVVDRAIGGTVAASIGDDSYITRLMSAFAEGSSAPRSATNNPIKQFNYCQIFKTAYEVTETLKRTKLRTGDPVKNDKKRASFKHSQALEWAIMFGVRHETIGSNGKPERLTGGLRYLLPESQQKVYTSACDWVTFLDDVYPVFDFDTPAGDERIMMMGNGFLNELNKLAQAQGDIRFGDTLRVYGMALRELIIPQGRLYFKTHPLLNRHARYKNSAFVLDPTALHWRYLRDTKSKDNIQTDEEDLQKGQWLTEGGLELGYNGVTCKYLGNFTADTGA